MKQPDSNSNPSNDHLQDLEKAIQALQDKLDSLAKTLKNIKNQLGTQEQEIDPFSKKENCISLLYHFIV